MSLVEGKRITFKRARPNPLFQDWLEELFEQAHKKKSKYESILKEALDSISKYPLPLQSGAECAILKGFDKRLCLFLDKRLEEYKLLNKVTSNSSPNGINISNSPPPKICAVTSLSSPIEENRSSEVHSSAVNPNPKHRKNKIIYKPAFRSGGYAILMGLLDHTTCRSTQSLQKDELINIAQKYCEESFTRPKPETFYTAWSNMSRLISKGLVKKTGSRKSQYSLTDLGISVANELFLDTQNMPTVNDIIFNDKSLGTASQNVENEVIVLEENSSKTDIFENISLIKNNFIDEQSADLDQQLIVMDAGTFDIILLIDKNETSGFSKKNDPTVAQFNKFPDLKHEYRSLKVGDFTWVARHKTSNEELVLPYVVERKRMDDLGASIKDGRFHEQKFRLRKCGLKHVIYMVESYGKNKYVGLPVQTLMQGLANTRVQDDFKVHVTDSLTHSTRFLAMMTLRLTFEFKNKRLKGHNKESCNDILMTFEFFNKSSIKNKPLSVTDTFIKLILQLKGVSVEKALAITNVYKTPIALIKAYELCTEKEGEILLANLKCGLTTRNVGPSVSKTIYQFFKFKNIS
ncbi:crossover junction endonuclease MUS81 [Vanessa atalanta]|uniref:crossover junction endonuclease MUS81 n=1 Tax=Vanessa atalanta TaxID=42275 RepID=UPI001FCD23C5|nr:crossover junction endonuclease MUS81 [Vanessa atalanta]